MRRAKLQYFYTLRTVDDGILRDDGNAKCVRALRTDGAESRDQ